MPMSTWAMNVEVTKDRDLIIVDGRHLKDVSCITRTRVMGFDLTENA